MTLSLSAIERGNPPPRRKSCVACTKAKRRCDLEDPTCARCAQRGLECVYPLGRSLRKRTQKVETRHVGPETLEMPDMASQLSSSTSLWRPVGAENGDGNGNGSCWAEINAFLSYPDPVVVDDFNVPEFGFGNTDGFLPDLTENEAILHPGLSSISGLGLYTPPLPWLGFGPTMLPDPTPLPASVPMSMSMSLSMPLILSQKQAREHEIPAHILETRLQFSLDKFLAAPRQMVVENQTPWCHPQLWQNGMPRCMEDALSCCALYMAKNTTNVCIILRTLESRVHDLVSIAAKPPSANSSSEIGFELLARTQALMLYQILRLSDGNRCARKAAEATVPALEDSAVELLQHITTTTAVLFGSESLDGDGGDDSSDSLPSTSPYADTCAYYPSHPETCLCSSSLDLQPPPLAFSSAPVFHDSSDTISEYYTNHHPHNIFPIPDTSSFANIPPPPLPPSTSTSSPSSSSSSAFWHAWIFAESARRTVMAVFFLTAAAAYRLVWDQRPIIPRRRVPGMADPGSAVPCDGRLGLGRHAAITMSAHLWRAENTAAFAAAWRGERHFVVTSADFREVIREAQASDIEVFGKMLLTTIMGIEESKVWLSSRGGTL